MTLVLIKQNYVLAQFYITTGVKYPFCFSFAKL